MNAEEEITHGDRFSDINAGGIELCSDTLIYSYFPGAITPQEALARLAASSSRPYLEPGMEFRVSRQRPNTALWDVEEVGKIWCLGIYQEQIAVTTDSATATLVQKTGFVPSDARHVQYLTISLKQLIPEREEADKCPLLLKN